MVQNGPAILNTILNISSFSLIFPLVFFLLFKKNNKEKTVRVIFFYTLYCILNEALGYYLQGEHLINPFIFFLALFTVLEFSFFCLFFYYAISIVVIKKIVLFTWLGFFIFSCIDFFYINKMGALGSVSIGIESILIIIMCVYYLYVQIRGSNNLFVYSTSNFWIIISFLIYLSGTFFLYIMADKMFYNETYRVQYNIINSAFNIIKNILLSVAMLMKPVSANNHDKRYRDLDDSFSYQLKN